MTAFATVGLYLQIQKSAVFYTALQSRKSNFYICK